MMNAESVLNGTEMLLQAYARRREKQVQAQKPVKVSVIIPVYNAMPYFAECMRSLMAQTLEEIEFIVVDDGSTDGSGAFADALADIYDTVRVIHQKNSGVSSARNTGLDAARGEYVGFVDADDFVEVDMFESFYTAAKTANAQIASTWFNCIYESDEHPPDKAFSYITPTLLKPENLKALLLDMNTNQVFHFTWRNLFERSFLVTENIRFNPKISIGEDTLFNMQAIFASNGVLMVIGTPYNYRIHQDSCMGKKSYNPELLSSLELQYEEKEKIFDEYGEILLPEIFRKTAEHNLTTLLPLLLRNIYLADVPKQLQGIKEVFTSRLFTESFKLFDIKITRSKSLDWVALWFSKNRMYLPAHLIYKRIVYSPK